MMADLFYLLGAVRLRFAVRRSHRIYGFFCRFRNMVTLGAVSFDFVYQPPASMELDRASVFFGLQFCVSKNVIDGAFMELR